MHYEEARCPCTLADQGYDLQAAKTTKSFWIKQLAQYMNGQYALCKTPQKKQSGVTCDIQNAESESWRGLNFP